MGLVSFTNPNDGETIDAADVATPLTTLKNEFNGNIDNDNIKSGANISGTKLLDASITYAKISPFDKARAKRTSTQLVGNGTPTGCSFTAVDYQRTGDDMWVIGDPTKIIIKTTGKYSINGYLSWAANTTGERTAEIYVNGSAITVDSKIAVTGGNATQHSVSANYLLIVGDYVELYGYQTSTGNLNINQSALSVALLP